MALSAQRWEELARCADVFGGRAVEAYLDGFFDAAAGLVDAAVEAGDELHRGAPDNDRIRGGLLGLLRWRAEIRLVLAAQTPGRAQVLVAGGIEDATRALALAERLDAQPPVAFPLRVADIRLLLSQMYAAAGRHTDAVRCAVASLEEHRRHHRAGDEHSDLGLAWALCRYAGVLDTVQANQSITARREALRLFRAHARSDGDLWQSRLSRGTTTLGTPTWERFCETALRVAAECGHPSVASAQEAMVALQDALEGLAALLPRLGSTSALLLGDPQYRDRRAQLADVVRQLVDWAQAISAPWLVRAYQEAGVALAAPLIGDECYDLVRPIRERLTQTLARLPQPRP